MKTLLAVLLVAVSFAAHAVTNSEMMAQGVYHIAVFGEINDKMALPLVGQILEAEAEDGNKPIVVYINSDGGSIPAGGMIIDAMRLCKRHPVYTVNIGRAISMGAVIFSYGTKRIVWPHSVTMYHKSMHGLSGSPEQLVSELAFTHSMIDGYEKDLAHLARMSVEQFRAKEMAEWWLTAEEAVAAHIADEIIKP